LEKVNGSTPFVRAYVTQNALGGHSIPVSKGALDVLYAVGVINDNEADKAQVPAWNGDSQDKGVEFGSLLQQLAAASSRRRVRARSKASERDRSKFQGAAHRAARPAGSSGRRRRRSAKVARDKARAEARAAAAAAEPKSKASSSRCQRCQAGRKTARPRRRQGKDKEQRNPHRCRPQRNATKKKPAVRAAKGWPRGSRGDYEDECRKSNDKRNPKIKTRMDGMIWETTLVRVSTFVIHSTFDFDTRHFDSRLLTPTPVPMAGHSPGRISSTAKRPSMPSAAAWTKLSKRSSSRQKWAAAIRIPISARYVIAYGA